MRFPISAPWGFSCGVTWGWRGHAQDAFCNHMASCCYLQPHAAPPCDIPPSSASPCGRGPHNMHDNLRLHVLGLLVWGLGVFERPGHERKHTASLSPYSPGQVSDRAHPDWTSGDITPSPGDRLGNFWSSLTRHKTHKENMEEALSLKIRGDTLWTGAGHIANTPYIFTGC